MKNPIAVDELGEIFAAVETGLVSNHIFRGFKGNMLSSGFNQFCLEAY